MGDPISTHIINFLQIAQSGWLSGTSALPGGYWTLSYTIGYSSRYVTSLVRFHNRLPICHSLPLHARLHLMIPLHTFHTCQTDQPNLTNALPPAAGMPLPALMPLLRCLIWISACDRFILVAKHLPGSKNQIADPLCIPEIQANGTGSRPPANTCTSLFEVDLSLNHPLQSLLDASLNSIIQAVLPRTLQLYLTAWNHF